MSSHSLTSLAGEHDVIDNGHDSWGYFLRTKSTSETSVRTRPRRLNRAARDPHRHAIERKRAATVDLCTDAGGILSFGHFSNGVGASVSNWAAAPAARVMRMREERIVLPLLLVIKRARLVTVALASRLAQRYNLRYPPRSPKTRPAVVNHCRNTVWWPGVR